YTRGYRDWSSDVCASDLDGGAVHVRVTVAQGGETEGAVLLAVFVVADPDPRLLKQPDHRREHLLARHPRPDQVRLRPLPDPGQRSEERRGGQGRSGEGDG